jgi:hypothetical protein
MVLIKAGGCTRQLHVSQSGHDITITTWGEADAGARHNSYFAFCLLILIFFVANLYIRYLPSSSPQYPSRFSTVLRIVYVFPSQ